MEILHDVYKEIKNHDSSFKALCRVSPYLLKSIYQSQMQFQEGAPLL